MSKCQETMITIPPVLSFNSQLHYLTKAVNNRYSTGLNYWFTPRCLAHRNILSERNLKILRIFEIFHRITTMFLPNVWTLYHIWLTCIYSEQYKILSLFNPWFPLKMIRLWLIQWCAVNVVFSIRSLPIN